MKKTYPISARIRQEEAIVNILAWVNNHDEDSDDDSDIEESPEEEFSDVEKDIEPPLSLVAAGIPDDVVPPQQLEPEPLVDANNNVLEEEEAEPAVAEEAGPKRKGRPQVVGQRRNGLRQLIKPIFGKNFSMRMMYLMKANISFALCPQKDLESMQILEVIPHLLTGTGEEKQN